MLDTKLQKIQKSDIIWHCSEVPINLTPMLLARWLFILVYFSFLSAHLSKLFILWQHKLSVCSVHRTELGVVCCAFCSFARYLSSTRICIIILFLHFKFFCNRCLVFRFLLRRFILWSVSVLLFVCFGITKFVCVFIHVEYIERIGALNFIPNAMSLIFFGFVWFSFRHTVQFHFFMMMVI